MIPSIVKQKLLKNSVKIKRNLPANIDNRDIDFYEPVRAYETYDCVLKYIKNSSISADSIVYQNGLLIDETLYSADYKSYYRFRYPLKKFFTAKKVKLDKNVQYLLVTDIESTGHFHWFTETLPRLMCIRDMANEFTLLLPDLPYIKNIALESLKLLQFDFKDIILMKDSELYKAENLHFVSKVCRTGQMNDELMQKINILFTSGEEKGNNKIYVSRERAGFRKILNEEDFTAMLKNNGFDILQAEDFTLSEQINIFSSCRTLLGIHGAGLTNVLFMHPESNLIELRRNEINVGYWFLADSSNHPYYYYNGIPDSEKTIVGRGCNLTIPLNDFEEKILKDI